MTPSTLPRTELDPRAAYRASQRGRLLVAVADSVAELGYAGLTVADVVARAGVSRRAFYENFADKEAAVLAAYDAAIATMIEQLVAVGTERASESPRVRTRAQLERFLALMADDPAAARLALVEILAVGAAGRERYSQATARFTLLLGLQHQEAREADPRILEASQVTLEAVGGGINRVITARVLDGRAKELPALADELSAFSAAVMFATAPPA